MTIASDQLDEHVGDVALLAKHMEARLGELRMSILAASKLGIVSRSTLTSLIAGTRVPNLVTLSKIDDLLSWESGSARRALHGEDPVPREARTDGHLPVGADPGGTVADADEDTSSYNYEKLMDRVELRLRELRMTKSRFASIGGPGRSTLATLGKRGYAPSRETLERIDTYLLWMPGSALAVLRGSEPTARGPVRDPHPSVVPLHAAQDGLKGLLARLTRQGQTIEQMQVEVDQALRQVNLAIADLGDPRRSDAAAFSDSGAPAEGAAGKGDPDD